MRRLLAALLAALLLSGCAALAEPEEVWKGYQPFLPEEPEEEVGVFGRMISSPIFYILLVIVLVLLVVAIVLLILNAKRKKKKAAEADFCCKNKILTI